MRPQGFRSCQRVLLAATTLSILVTAACCGNAGSTSQQSSSPAKSAVTVVSTLPNSGATGVPTNNSVAVVLNTGIDSSTLNSITSAIICGGIQVQATPAYDPVNHTLVIHLSSLLPFNSSCTVTIGGSIGPFSFSFTTSNAPDLIAPTIATVSPAANATGVPSTTKVTVQFSQAMDPTFLNGQTTTGVAVTYNYDPTTFTATLVPASPLQPNTTYKVTVSGKVRDMWGNPLGQDYSWTFSTGN